MQGEPPNHFQQPASFGPSLVSRVIGMVAVVVFFGAFVWLTVTESSWMAGAVSTALAAPVVAISVDSVLWHRRGPVLHVVDPLGLCKGRAGRLRQLFSWSELKAWSHHEPSEGGNYWRFETTGKTWHVHEHEVCVPSARRFETAVRTASDKPCTYPDLFKSGKDAAAERFKI